MESMKEDKQVLLHDKRVKASWSNLKSPLLPEAPPPSVGGFIPRDNYPLHYALWVVINVVPLSFVIKARPPTQIQLIVSHYLFTHCTSLPIGCELVIVSFLKLKNERRRRAEGANSCSQQQQQFKSERWVWIWGSVWQREVQAVGFGCHNSSGTLVHVHWHYCHSKMVWCSSQTPRPRLSPFWSWCSGTISSLSLYYYALFLKNLLFDNWLIIVVFWLKFVWDVYCWEIW